ncbi:MAG TPA: hypothetical protein VK129_11960 [Terriglobales bacterium]|nr:hypothetical protein [Terriglobales bacterium]
MMVRGKLRDQFPFFFHYLVLQSVTSSVLFVLFHLKNYPVYFYAYWTCGALRAALGFAVIHEIFDNTFRSFVALRDFSRIIFRWAASILAMMVGVMMITSSASGSSRVIMGILTVERGVLLIQSGLLLFLLMYSSRLGLTWKHHGFGIALGLGFNASVHLILNSLSAKLGPSWNPTYNLLANLCYNVAVVTWAAYMFSPEPARVTEASQYEPKPVLQRWNQVLAGEDSLGGTFIPNMERIVDRVMARKH